MGYVALIIIILILCACTSIMVFFLMDKDLRPKVVAGCAPDAFSRTGQLWGNPIYDWKAQAAADIQRG